jgi:hypothetical protein
VQQRRSSEPQNPEPVAAGDAALDDVLGDGALGDDALDAVIGGLARPWPGIVAPASTERPAFPGADGVA